ncbi:MAG TPA: twin-arginine translocase TatA/TatE family subunit [Candidatus Limnocylindrales bacterium]|jgi:TatA/E family protein of Tat protein translocase
MPNIGPVELVIILVIALLVIGPGKLPDVGSALGKSIREFRKAATDVQESVKLDAPIAPVAPAPAPVPAAPAPVAPAPAPAAPVAAVVAPPAVVTVPAAAPAVNTLAAPATPNELSAPAAPDPAAAAADAPTEARV